MKNARSDGDLFVICLKSRKKRQTKSGQAAVKIKPWKYEKQMEFLLPVSAPRQQRSNYSTVNEFVVTTEQEEIGETVETESVDTGSSHDIFCPPASPAAEPSSVGLPSVGPSLVGPSSSPARGSASSRRGKRLYSSMAPSTPSAATVLKEYLDNKKEAKKDHLS
jgi:hypothetical protein